MTTSRDESRAIFERAIEHTRGLSPATFDQWFGGVQFDDLTDGVLSLRVQNEFVLEWVKTNFLPTITDKIRELTGWSVQVAWTIDQHLEAPIANVPQMPPVRPRSLVVRPSTNPPTAPAPASPSAPVAAEPRPPAPAPAPQRRPALPDDLNPKHTFATFVVGPSNQLAHAAAIAAAGGGGRRYNPLFICGGTGLGKTHLVHAIAHRVLDERPGARIIYVSAERFTNDFITAIQHHRMDDFRAKYRVHCDLLLVDDIQFLAGREQTQEEFFHTFNALHGLDRQIVVTSDKYPQNLERMEERLVSRFSWGLVADIQAPELETRVAIVRNKAALEGIVLPDDVALYLAQVIRSNVRELEGTLIRLAAKSSLTGRPVDLAFARAEITAATPRASIMSVEDIQRAVCHHFHLRSIDLTSKDRHKSIAFARHVAMYLCKQRLKVSFPEIGRAFGNRDHTTVMSAVRKIEAQRDTDPQVRAHLEALERKLAGDS
ncbi:chromosomal replication initiator protein DnaA [Polyangium jinanense]|uniref:Chromosomal replication initiator protein DnaA n=1 Tax=Polyangium jinanense TaxID=2829994 RepID=A0A9X4APH2_9BACT|nr:chromosomal replication initiator protein DnaA [Polyangium jinanense]MDC3953583.1 chromosomal replication initiator protein DnaA [Polyangium jinanense]MDC3979296.1 chromosomal replication initiator protein DnaA [Polyangium jinanense]